MSKRGSSSTSTNINSRGVVVCKHKVACVVNTSGTDLNPDRQFYGCPYWMVIMRKKLRVFRWVHGMVAEGEEQTSAIRSSQLKLEESLRVAESKAEIRKKEKKFLVEELSMWMKAQELMVAEGSRVANDICLIRYHITVVVLNFLLIVLLRQHQFVM
ncbi:unnamed protein product [Linum trigynum]|uniref:Zinc finger GRF-type domain-containing protein n=1 Tax=Linum trigynum TaxID=586398 RepID=A0AAV2GLT4_9ROSI